ncbi:peptidoglycan D,D-transpeptidase FtsI family protein [Calditerrivibrio nitroreducens]|uniref:Peptidoglycan glycosyltransferase n=1 Tax=Calditerrivibrio nitroreducens (strain DSM 19672 / NBRC 101217 / Yu37-1) TaxID=768670 RepID=E4TFY1_CALNY|nr:penicillin-binding protein 2 [Calditerrivibrio nitroreducens]ADR19637.1 Peptidoglycan glycosyltransferase [Calditerrivibrio nitroreducens DSM 19672]
MWSEKNRLRLTILAIFLFVVGIIARLVYLQIVKYDFYYNISVNQSSKEFTIIQNRAVVTDRNGVVIAKNKKVASLYAFSKQIDDPKSLIAEMRSKGIWLSKKTTQKILNQEGFVWIKRGVDIDTAEYFSKKYKSVGYIVDEGRYYPYNTLFSQIVGFVGVDNQGLYGVEKLYDEDLKGEEISIIALKDSTGKYILFHDKEEIIAQERSFSITIDKNMQLIAELSLMEGVQEFGADKGIAIGMDVKNGEILFAVTYPGFDANKFSNYSQDLWKNYSTFYLFEPGSIMKPFTFIYLLEHDMLNLNENIFCENGKYDIYNHTIKDVHPYGTLSASDVLVKSSNIGTIKLNSKIPAKDFYEYLKSLGFGSATQVLGSGEESGLLRNYKKWSGLSQPSISIGQEILVTPIQIVRLYAAIANGGYLFTPKFVKSNEKPVATKVFGEKSLSVVRPLLREVVERGTATTAKSEYVPIAGKTGTAQKFDKRLGRYSNTEYTASFAGYFPYDDPKVSMVVIYENPKKSIYGGTTAAVTFKKIAEQTAILLGYKIKHLRIKNVG